MEIGPGTKAAEEVRGAEHSNGQKTLGAAHHTNVEWPQPGVTGVARSAVTQRQQPTEVGFSDYGSKCYQLCRVLDTVAQNADT